VYWEAVVETINGDFDCIYRCHCLLALELIRASLTLLTLIVLYQITSTGPKGSNIVVKVTQQVRVNKALEHWNSL